MIAATTTGAVVGFSLAGLGGMFAGALMGAFVGAKAT